MQHLQLLKWELLYLYSIIKIDCWQCQVSVWNHSTNSSKNVNCLIYNHKHNSIIVTLKNSKRAIHKSLKFLCFLEFTFNSWYDIIPYATRKKVIKYHLSYMINRNSDCYHQNSMNWSRKPTLWGMSVRRSTRYTLSWFLRSMIQPVGRVDCTHSFSSMSQSMCIWPESIRLVYLSELWVLMRTPNTAIENWKSWRSRRLLRRLLSLNLPKLYFVKWEYSKKSM